MPASSSSAVTRATNCSRGRAQLGLPGGVLLHGARRTGVARPASAASRGARLESGGQRRRDDVAGLEVAVRRGAARAGARRTARRRRRPRRRPGPRPPAARSCGSAVSTCATSAGQAVAASTRSGGSASPGPRAAHQPSSSARSGRGRGPACPCTSASGRARTARPSPGAGRPRSPAAAPRARVDVEPERPASRAPRGCRRELRLAGVGRVGAGVEPREVPVQRRLGGPVAGGVGDDSGASMRDQAVALDVRRQRGRRSRRRCATVRDVHQPAVVVEHGQPGGLACSPQARSTPTKCTKALSRAAAAAPRPAPRCTTSAPGGSRRPRRRRARRPRPRASSAARVSSCDSVHAAWRAAPRATYSAGSGSATGSAKSPAAIRCTAAERAAPPISTMRRGVDPGGLERGDGVGEPAEHALDRRRGPGAPASRWRGSGRAAGRSRRAARGCARRRGRAAAPGPRCPSTDSASRSRSVELGAGHPQRGADHAGGVERADQRQEPAGGVGEAGDDAARRRRSAGPRRRRRCRWCRARRPRRRARGRGRGRRPCCRRCRARARCRRASRRPPRAGPATRGTRELAAEGRAQQVGAVAPSAGDQ